jgi:hypothetical protein
LRKAQKKKFSNDKAFIVSVNEGHATASFCSVSLKKKSNCFCSIAKVCDQQGYFSQEKVFVDQKYEQSFS